MSKTSHTAQFPNHDFGERATVQSFLEKSPRRMSRMNVNDLLVLAAAGEAVLKTNTALKGERRRMLRNAVNRALKFVETL